MAAFSSAREFADSRLVAAAALGPLVGQRGGLQRLAGLCLHLHRLHAIEIGRIIDDRRAARGEVGEGDLRSGVDNRRSQEKPGKSD